MPVCVVCLQSFHVKPSRLARGNVQYCSRGCRSTVYAQVHRTVRKDGYVQITGGGLNILEHRMIMEQHLGRKLEPREHVHHKNDDRTDNRLENLEVLDIVDHAIEHGPKKDPTKWQTLNCRQCDKPFDCRVPLGGKPSAMYCSRECWKVFCAAKTNHSCHHCGQQFHATLGAYRKYCSLSCSGIGRRKSAL